MRIGLIASGYEMLPLMEVLNQYNHHYHLFVDWQMRPRGAKNPDLRRSRIAHARAYLRDEVDVVIVPPVIELELLATATENKNLPPVFPLFTTYLQEYAFRYSIVGKLGLLSEYADLASAQNALQQIATNFVLTDHQQALGQKFHYPFSFWKEEVTMWTYFLTTYGKRDPHLRATIKHDLRSFRDAAVDTLIPLSRGFLGYQRIISQRTNWKKIRFHGLNAVQQCFETIMTNAGSGYPTSDNYQVTIHSTDVSDRLPHKKRQWMLSKGKSIEIENKYVAI